VSIQKNPIVQKEVFVDGVWFGQMQEMFWTRSPIGIVPPDRYVHRENTIESRVGGVSPLRRNREAEVKLCSAWPISPPKPPWLTRALCWIWRLR
jgi:hypothetical protein